MATCTSAIKNSCSATRSSHSRLNTVDQAIRACSDKRNILPGWALQHSNPIRLKVEAGTVEAGTHSMPFFGSPGKRWSLSLTGLASLSGLLLVNGALKAQNRLHPVTARRKLANGDSKPPRSWLLRLFGRVAHPLWSGPLWAPNYRHRCPV